MADRIPAPPSRSRKADRRQAEQAARPVPTSTSWGIRAVAVMASCVWVHVGLTVGGDRALSENAPPPAVPTLLVMGASRIVVTS